MARRPDPSVQSALSALGASADRRRMAGELSKGGTEAGRLPERLGQTGLRRPDGAVVWVHLADATREAPALDLVRRIGEAQEDARLLVTSAAPLAATALPAGAMHQLAPQDTARAAAAFLDHWAPGACVWVGAPLAPAVIAEAGRRGVALALADASAAPPPRTGWRPFAPRTDATLGRFDVILARDAAAAAALRAAGAPSGRVTVAGALEEEIAALPCNVRERDSFAENLGARPVWLAVGVPSAEETAIVNAHRASARLAHRLLTIIVPADPARAPALVQRLSLAGFSVATRSGEAEPVAETEIFVADTGESELGLWYRLAPVSFMGGTLMPGMTGARPPQEPAALGSAILHGPHLGAHAAAYARFAEAGATRAVAGAEPLAQALSDLLSPDRAATMAHAAWSVSTRGAEVSDRLVAFVADALGGRG
jgi:3-deoxy-D-manno-octulosonic-acid transferase